MIPELLVYLGAVVMVIIAILAYRYWNSTAEFARREREKQARRMHEALLAAAAAPPAADEEAGTTGEAGASVGEAAGGEPAPVEEPEEAKSEAPSPVADETEPEEAEPEPAEAEPEPAEAEPDDTAPEPGGREPEPEEEFEPDVAGAIAHRLIDELEPRKFGVTPGDKKTITAQLENLEEQLEGLPTGLELMELPVVERRRVADRRRALEQDRARLLEHHKGGAHRRRRQRKDSG